MTLLRWAVLFLGIHVLVIDYDIYEEENSLEHVIDSLKSKEEQIDQKLKEENMQRDLKSYEVCTTAEEMALANNSNLYDLQQEMLLLRKEIDTLKKIRRVR